MAVADHGRLLDLRSEMKREEVVAAATQLARETDQATIGLDFAFSFPAWYCRDQGWDEAREVWNAVATEGEALLEDCANPFWGRPGKPNPHRQDKRYRLTEQELIAQRVAPKSVFQIGGAGAVGTGSIRGMPHLLSFDPDEFSIWPFDRPRSCQVVEIYSRLLTGKVVKRRRRDRREQMRRLTEDLTLLERAVCSEDAFDAAVSAIEMSRHPDGLARLTQAAPGSRYGIEGRIWAAARP
jgi:hypothetical protein